MQSEGILKRQPPPPDSTIAYGPDPSHFAEVRLPSGNGPYPVAFFIHGGYWRAKYDLGYAGHLCEALRQTGIATWNIEYRRVGQSGGGWPGTFDDIRSAYLMLRGHATAPGSELDLNRLCVAGHSAGGQLALCLAAREPSVRRVLSLAGVVDLHRAWDLHLSNDAVKEFLGGSPQDKPEVYRQASPAELSIPHARQVLVHGTDDDSVPYEFSRDYVDRKKRSGEAVELVTLPHTGHFEMVDPGSVIWPQMLDLFQLLTLSAQL